MVETSNSDISIISDSFFIYGSKIHLEFTKLTSNKRSRTTIEPEHRFSIDFGSISPLEPL